MAGKGETKFDSNWDDSGNRVRKAAPAPRAKKVAAPAVQEEAPMAETPAAEATPAASEPAAETTTPAMDMDVPPAE
ncbi:MAG: hypothetical protein EON60_09290 [Alphaproteobacteria bacterium]|nr:MAG: hypothetical protein EON60_09290 [Alphaproteobacteria bacterium]